MLNLILTKVVVHFIKIAYNPLSSKGDHLSQKQDPIIEAGFMLFSSYLVTSVMKICLHAVTNSELLILFTTHLQYIKSFKLSDCKYVTIF